MLPGRNAATSMGDCYGAGKLLTCVFKTNAVTACFCSGQLLVAIDNYVIKMSSRTILPHIGIAEIDAQHAQLLSYLERLELWIGKGNGIPAAIDSVLAVQKYAATHFAYEEAFMRVHNFPGLEKHIVEHQKITDQVEKLTRVVLDGGDISEDLCQMLRYWITEHIGIEDIEYAKYFGTDKSH